MKISVPNAELAQKNLENVSRRDKFWFHQVFGLRYDTSPQQMRAILTGIEETLSKESTVEQATHRVRFIGFGESSMTLEIFAYVVLQDYDAYLGVQQRQPSAGGFSLISSARLPVASQTNSSPTGNYLPRRRRRRKIPIRRLQGLRVLPAVSAFSQFLYGSAGDLVAGFPLVRRPRSDSEPRPGGSEFYSICENAPGATPCPLGIKSWL